MKELVIISGKGGSGKTSMSSSLISLAGNCIICDCDVEAPNLHILLQPEIKKTEDFHGLPKAHIDLEECIKCDICLEKCRFGAISDYVVLEDNCEGCHFCYRLCPVDAITMVDHVCGQSFLSTSPYGTMFHARLGIGEQNSGKLVALLREKAREFAIQQNEELIIIDGPPGIGCPTIATLSGADMAVIVSEPTMSAIHDMIRTIDLCNHFKIKHTVIINKADLNQEKTEEIYRYCQEASIPVLGKLPFDKRFRDAINNRQNPVDYSPQIKEMVSPIWQQLKTQLFV